MKQFKHYIIVIEMIKENEIYDKWVWDASFYTKKEAEKRKNDIVNYNLVSDEFNAYVKEIVLD